MDISDLIIALALRMRSNIDHIREEEINTNKLYFTILEIYKEWYKNHKEDREFLALLSIAAASPWLYADDSEKFTDLLYMIEEVIITFLSNIKSESNVSQFSENGIIAALKLSLGATVESCQIQNQYVKILFYNAHFRSRVFDGLLYLHPEKGLYLFDESHNECQEFVGPTPATDEELAKALSSILWICHNEYQSRPNNLYPNTKYSNSNALNSNNAGGAFSNMRNMNQSLSTYPNQHIDNTTCNTTTTSYNPNMSNN